MVEDLSMVPPGTIGTFNKSRYKYIPKIKSARKASELRSMKEGREDPLLPYTRCCHTKSAPPPPEDSITWQQMLGARHHSGGQAWNTMKLPRDQHSVWDPSASLGLQEVHGKWSEKVSLFLVQKNFWSPCTWGSSNRPWKMGITKKKKERERKETMHVYWHQLFPKSFWRACLDPMNDGFCPPEPGIGNTFGCTGKLLRGWIMPGDSLGLWNLSLLLGHIFLREDS